MSNPFISFDKKKVIEWIKNSIEDKKKNKSSVPGFDNGWIMAMETIIRVIDEDSWKQVNKSEEEKK